MPYKSINQEVKIQNIEVTQELYDQQQEQAWDLVNNFSQTQNTKNKSMVKGAKYDVMNISELRDELMKDSGSKSESYNLMTREVDRFLKLATTKGEYVLDGMHATASFFDAFYQAKEAVNRYIFAHSGYKWSDKGERRMQLSMRVKALLSDMELKLDENQKALYQKEARMQEYKKQGLTQAEIDENEDLIKANAKAEDIKRIIENGDLGPEIPIEQEQKAVNTWVAKDYSKQLTKIVEGKELSTKDDKTNFLAFMEDKNNRIIANRIALSLVLDRKKDITKGMPWIREEMEEFIKSKLQPEDLFLKTKDYLIKVNNTASTYVVENAERLTLYRTRLKKIQDELKIGEEDINTFGFKSMKDLITEPDEDAFRARFDLLKNINKPTDDFIEERLKKNYSIATRDAIRKKLYKHLGSFRMFGNSDQVMVQANMFFEMLAFTAPEEFSTERQLKTLMDSHLVEDVHRDAFLKELTKSRPSEFAKHKNSHWKSDAKKIASRIKENSAMVNELFKTKYQYLTKRQWDQMEEKLANCASIKKKDLEKELRAIAYYPINASEKRISRKEYTDKRNLDEARKIPAMKQKTRAEKKKLEKLGNSMDKKFYILLSGDGENIYQPYRAWAAAYQDKMGEFKEKNKQEKERYERRKKDLKYYLWSAGIPENRYEEYNQRFKWIMSGLLDIDDDMSDDVRLYTQRKNLEKFGVRSWEEAARKIQSFGEELKDLNNADQIKGAKELYEKGLDVLDNFEGGKYKEFSQAILSIPEVYVEMLRGPALFKGYLSKVLNVRLADFIEGCNKAGKFRINDDGSTSDVTFSSVRKQYAHMYIKSIFDGSLSGGADFFADQVTGFQKRLFSVAPAGGVSVNSSLSKARDLIKEECKKADVRKDVYRILEIGILQKLMEKADDIEGLQMLTNKEAVSKFVKQQVKDYKGQFVQNEKEKTVERQIQTQLNSVSVPSADEVEQIKEKIRTNKKEGFLEKRKFLKINDYVLGEVRQRKTLIRLPEKDRKAITLDQSRINKMRGRVDRYCDSLELPQVLKDALIEHGAVGGILPGFTETYGSSDLLYNHALAMKRMFNLLRTDAPVGQTIERGMGEEEALMYIVKCYGNSELLPKLFDKPEKLNVTDLRKQPDYKAFREAYKKLAAFEEKTSSDPALQQEMDQLSADLRTMLITGTGVRDEQNKTVTKDLDTTAHMKRIGEVIDRSTRYVDYCNKVMEAVRPEFLKIYKESADASVQKEDNLPQHYVDKLMSAMRQYLMPEIIKKLTAKTPFDPEYWKQQIGVFRQKEYRRYLDNEKDSFFLHELKRKEQSAFGEDEVNEKTLAKVINGDQVFFKGKLNKYNDLDEEQKLLFAIGLIFVDESAIGLGAEGTISLTSSAKKTARENDAIRKELEKYVSGQPYYFHINYRQAVNKLMNYGVTWYGNTEYNISETAYEKAMQFAKNMSAKKKAFGEKDMERMADGYSSMFAAYTNYNKKQLTKIEPLRDKELTLEEVKDKLVQYAKDDKLSYLAEMGKTVNKNKILAPVVPLVAVKELVTVDKTASWNSRMNNIIKRLSGMNEENLRIFVRILQNRTVLDKSCIQKDGEVLHVDQLQRNALLEALSGDMSQVLDVLEGFDDSQSCFQALVSAFSFQLRDDKNFAGKPLTQDCFESKSFKRKTLVDWDLIDNALSFYDEIMQKRTFIEATKNAGDLINYSGNQKAIQQYKKFKSNFLEKKDFKQDNFEAYVKENANKDKLEDADGALAGYYCLTDQQKVLFFKALCRRDILDISKKDYNKSFFNIKDRNYVNQADRDQLIDSYIAANKDDNVGLSLEPDEYYRAMEMLFSTQVSDRVQLTKTSDIKKVFSSERNFVMGRNTAIDWKLFKRALNFVHRATEELEMTEGNALLYRGAGDLEKNGRMNMNYGFLRKNFHRTGNQWTRALFNFGGSAAKVNLDKKDVSGMALKALAKDVGAATKVVGFDKDGFVQTGTKQLSEFAKTAQKKKEEVLDQTEAKNTIVYQKLQDKIDDVIKKNKTGRQIFEKAEVFLEQTLFAEAEKIGDQIFTKEKAASPDMENVVEETTKGMKKDNTYGDIRDDVIGAQKNVKKILKTKKNVKNIVKSIGPKQLYNLIDLVDVTVQKAAYKFLDDKVLGLSAEERGKELKELKAAADKYVKDKIEEYARMMVGNESVDEYKKLMDRFYDYVKDSSSIVHDAMKTIYFVNYTSDNVINIANCAGNLRLISSAKEQSAVLKRGDSEKLEKAKTSKRLDEGQLDKAKKAAEKNQALTDTAASISKSMQALGIADSAIKIALNTARVAGAGFGLTTEVMHKTISAGLEFANFALRIMTDRNALKDYYVHTEAGKREVEKIKNGYQLAGKTALYTEFKKQSDPKTASTSLVDMISDVKGFEHTAELVEYTGMSMAQSIVFSASEFNPMAESKLMAITVMSVMGLEKLIGDTSPKTVEMLFKAFKMAR